MADAPIITIPVGDIAGVIGDYTSIRIYRATTRGGSYSLLTTLTLVSGTTYYQHEDTTATAGGTDWYKDSFYNTGTTAESALSEPFPAGLAPVMTRQDLRRRAAYEMGCYIVPGTTYTWPGPSGTSTAAGSTTSLVDSNYINSLTPTLAYTGSYILLNGGSASGQERQVASFDRATGAFTMTPAYSASTGSGTSWDGYKMLGSSSWNECIEQARKHVWTPFWHPVGGIQGQTDYPMPYWLERDEQFLSLRRQTGETIDQYQYQSGPDFELRTDGSGGTVLHIPSTLTSNGVYRLEGYRNPPPYTADSGTAGGAWPLSEGNQRLWLLRTCMEAAQRIMQTRSSVAEDRSEWAKRLVVWKSEATTLDGQLNEWKRRARSPRRSRLVSVGGSFTGNTEAGARSRYY